MPHLRESLFDTIKCFYGILTFFACQNLFCIVENISSIILLISFFSIGCHLVARVNFIVHYCKLV